MEEIELDQQGTRLSATFRITNSNLPHGHVLSPEYHIGGVAVLQLRSTGTAPHFSGLSHYTNAVSIKFTKRSADEVLNYTIKLNSKKMNLDKKCFIDNDGTWRLIHKNELTEQTFVIDLDVEMDFISDIGPFASKYDDRDTDFELRGVDGSVRMHRAALAASSPVLKSMLEGTWSESTEGIINVPGTSQLTLQHFKDYVYLRTLPESGLEQVMLLASYYMMTELEQKCLFRLVGGLTAQNAFDWLEFAFKHKSEPLLYAILESFQRGAVEVNHMRGLVFNDGDATP